LLKAEEFEPVLGFTFGKSQAFLCWLFDSLFSAQSLDDIIPENLGFHGCCSSRLGCPSQSVVAAYDYQSSRRGAQLYLLLDYGISIGGPAYKQNLQIGYIIELAFVCRSSAVKNNLAALAIQFQIPADNPAQLNIAN